MNPVLALFDGLFWWTRLTATQQLFYSIGIAAGFVTLIMALLGLIGFDHHDATDVGGVDAHDGGTSLLSTKPITGFFLGFGWTGGIALEHGQPLWIATLLAAGVGFLLMLAIAAMIRGIYSLRTDGTRKITDAVGAIGTVYVTLPPSRASGGQITVTVSGRLETLSALNTAGRPLPSGEKVKVVGVVDTSTVLVEPLA